jgi:hypothetical protein
MGVANAIVEILTTTMKGSLTELKAKMNPPVRVNPVSKAKSLENNMVDDRKRFVRVHNKTLFRRNVDEIRRNICPGKYTATGSCARERTAPPRPLKIQ